MDCWWLSSGSQHATIATLYLESWWTKDILSACGSVILLVTFPTVLICYTWSHEMRSRLP
jgi:hypothetical protein